MKRKSLYRAGTASELEATGTPTRRTRALTTAEPKVKTRKPPKGAKRKVKR